MLTQFLSLNPQLEALRLGNFDEDDGSHTVVETIVTYAKNLQTLTYDRLTFNARYLAFIRSMSASSELSGGY